MNATRGKAEPPDRRAARELAPGAPASPQRAPRRTTRARRASRRNWRAAASLSPLATWRCMSARWASSPGGSSAAHPSSGPGSGSPRDGARAASRTCQVPTARRARRAAAHRRSRNHRRIRSARRRWSPLRPGRARPLRRVVKRLALEPGYRMARDEGSRCHGPSSAPMPPRPTWTRSRAMRAGEVVWVDVARVRNYFHGAHRRLVVAIGEHVDVSVCDAFAVELSDCLREPAGRRAASVH